MIKNISTPSKSFLILFLIAFFGTFFCLSLWINFGGQVVGYENSSGQYHYQQRASTKNKRLIEQQALPLSVDTSSWQTYTNKSYGFSFLYSPDWKVLTIKKQGDYQILQIDPGKKYYNFKIYISTKDYYALAGIPTETDSIGGLPAISADGLLYGVKSDSYYYTFDIGQSANLKQEFDTLVHSVKFQ